MIDLVIRIQEEVYDEILDGIENAEIAGVGLSDFCIALKNGTPLPKGHGDLIDAYQEMRLMQSCDYDTYEDYSRAFDMLDNAPTIIEADKEVDE